ncbi:Tetratricopeptide TPR_2 repeat-containing protein [Methylomonas methanica MC09]|uniref:Tetratricopeptide TPR_2 repeat-containing protein n=2 Tax=Methylomonas methanica TaxID=421 RepID=G0A241_METMM|nr:Tetratricopeptide TPR_2 repeat-containing protein [Methylomonas methanica MC09]
MDKLITIFSQYKVFYRIAKLSAICAVLLITGCQAEDAQYYIAEGKSLYEKGDLESARVQFKNALQIDPKLAEVYYRLALVDEQKQDWRGMLANLTAVLELNSDHIDAKVKLAQLHLLGGQLDQASEYVQSVLTQSPDYPTALLLAAAIKFRQGKNAEAFQEVEYVLAAEPFLADAIGLQVNILTALQRNNEALSLARIGVLHNPDDAELWTQKIRLEVDLEQFEEAIRDYRALIERFPENAEYRLDLADLYHRIGRTDQAEQLIDDASKQYPSQMVYRYKLVDFVEQRDEKKAEALLIKFIKDYPRESGLTFKLADLYIAQQRFAGAERLLQDAADRDIADEENLVKRNIKLAEIASKQQNLARVEQLADEILKIDINQSDALLLRAGIRLNKLDADGAISDLRIVLRDRPNLEHAMLLLAQASLVKGQPEVAEGYLRKTLESNPDNAAALASLARELLKRGALASAEEITRKQVQASPNNTVALEMLIQVRALRGDWKGAAEALAKLEKLPGAQSTTRYWAARLASLQGNTDSAIKGYQALLQQQPSYTKALTDLVQIYETNGRRRELIEYLQSQLNKFPDSVPLLSVLAATYILDQRWAEGEAKVRKAVELTPEDLGLKLKLVDIIEVRNADRAEAQLKELLKSAPNDARLVFRFSRFYQERQRYPEAETLLKAFANDNHGNRNAINARVKLAELAWARHDLLEAKTRINQILVSESDNTDALMLRAALSVAEQAYLAALVDLRKVLEVEPESEQALALMAQVYMQQGLVQNVEETWRRVLGVHPGNMSGLQFTVKQLVAKGDWQQAFQYIDKAIDANPGNPQYVELRIRLLAGREDWPAVESEIARASKQPRFTDLLMRWKAKLAMRRENYSAAIKIYSEWLEQRPTNSEALTGLAHAFQRAGQSKELIAYLESQIHKAPGFDEAYWFLAQSYAADKNWAAAEQLLRDKLSRMPGDGHSWGLLGKVYADQGKDLEAEKTFQAGLTATVNDAALMADQAAFYVVRRQFDKAVSVYERILGISPDNVVAINNLANLLVNQRRHNQDDIRRALNLVEPLRKSNDPALLDTFAWVQLKSGSVATALPVLQRAANSAPKNSSILYHLAEALSQAGDKTAARVQLERLFAIQDKDGFMELEAAQTLLNSL